MFEKLYKNELLSNVFYVIGRYDLTASGPITSTSDSNEERRKFSTIEMSNNYTVFRTADFTYLPLHINNWAF